VGVGVGVGVGMGVGVGVGVGVCAAHHRIVGAAKSTDAMVFDSNVCVSISVFVPVCVCVCVALSKRVCKSDRHTRATQVTCGSTLPLVGRVVIKNSICVCVCVRVCVCVCVCVCA